MLKIEHEAGFFSCCSIRLQTIINYHNEHKKCPDIIDSKNLFSWYKNNIEGDITFDYFEHYVSYPLTIEYISHNYYYEGLQFSNYKNLKFETITPFIKKYFTLSPKIQEIIKDIELKYNIHGNGNDYSNLCVLFYRGNDKASETSLCSYEEYIVKAREIQNSNPNIQFLIQSDETEFIEKMLKEFPLSLYFKDETRSINKDSTSTVDWKLNHLNYQFSKYFLAIIVIMSKCQYVVCGSGNCSIWITFYRENSDNIFQNLNGTWL